MSGPAWGERQQKRIVRAFQLDVAGPKKQMLMFPGWDLATQSGAHCIHAALSSGLINRRTRLLCVERDKALVAPIEQHLDFLGLASRTRIHAADLHYLVLAAHERFDFAYFDFLGGLPLKTALWIADAFTPQIADGADISLTLARNDRGNPLYRDCAHAFETQYQSEAEWARGAFQVTDPQDLVHVLMVITLFREFRFHYHAPYVYQDGTAPMLGFKLTGVTRLPEPAAWPTIHDLRNAGRARRYRPAIRRDKDFQPGTRMRRMLRQVQQNIDGLLVTGLLDVHPEIEALRNSKDAIARILAASKAGAKNPREGMA